MTFVLVHDTHGHAEEAKTGCSGTLQTLAEDASHGGYIAGGISATYTDKGANGQPALSATDQHVVQIAPPAGRVRAGPGGHDRRPPPARPTRAADRPATASIRATGSRSTAS